MNREQAIEFGTMWLDINEDAKDSQTYQFFKIATDLLKSMSSKESKWIPAAERLPKEHICDDGYVEPSDMVLIKTVNGNVTASRYWGNRQARSLKKQKDAHLNIMTGLKRNFGKMTSQNGCLFPNNTKLKEE